MVKLEQSACSIIQQEFNKLCKTIYISPETRSFYIDEYGNKLSYGSNSFQIDMVLYTILSQYFKRVKIRFGGEEKDLRISFFLIMPSRLGKGQLIKVVEKVGTNIGLRVKRISYINQASLIGSLDGAAITYNVNHNYRIGHPRHRNPIMFGALANTDIIIFPEAKKLVKGTNESETEFILSTFQEALDYPGVINKELKYTDYPISYESTASVFATTYYLAEVSSLLMSQGFFQRIVTYKQDYNLDQIKTLRAEIIEKYRSSSGFIDFDVCAKSFSSMIKGLNSSERIITFSDSSVNKLHTFNNAFFNSIKEVSGLKAEILKSFSQTVIETVVKISAINCCCREGKEVVNEDMIPAINLFKYFKDTIINELVVSEKKDDTYQFKIRIIQLYKEFVGTNARSPKKSELIDLCKKKGMGFNKSNRIINVMEKENYFLVAKESHNSQFLKLNKDL